MPYDDRRTITTLDELRGLVGSELGVGAWFTLDQQRVDAFAEVSGDHQWIHVDAERAGESAYGSTIAHGFLLLVMAPLVRGYELRLPVAHGVNYGVDRVRFPAALPVGTQVRQRSTLVTLDESRPGEVQLTIRHVVEGEGLERPVCVYDHITRFYLAGA